MRKAIWSLAFRYDDLASAGRAYEECRKLLLANVSASVYRIELNSFPHVIVVGDEFLAKQVRGGFARAGTDDTEAKLPDEVLNYLAERREKATMPGVSWERRGF